MRFDIVDALRVDAGNRERFSGGHRLPVNAGRKIARFPGPIIVDGRPQDHGVNVIAVAQRVFEPAKRYDSGAATKKRTIGIIVKRSAAARGGQNFALCIPVSPAMRQVDTGASGKRHIAFTRQQALHRHVNGHQGGRTRRLNANAGPVQVQQIGNPGGQKVLVVAGVAQKEHAFALNKLRIAEKIEGQIGLHAAATKHADRTVKLVCRHMTGVFERFPAAFKKMPVLRIEYGRFTGAEPEETGIEHFHVRQRHCGANVARVLDCGERLSGCDEFLRRQPARGVAACLQH